MSTARAAISKSKVEGFGFVPEESEHHFVVTIDARQVFVSEHFTWDESEARRKLRFDLGAEDDKLRVVLPLSKWEEIAEAVATEFNNSLRRMNLKPGRWKSGQTSLSRLFGKELCLLAWAIEDADPSLVPYAVRNWLGLRPEERWWLFTMTNAATGHAITGRNKGWRKAIRFALTENPVSDFHRRERELPELLKLATFNESTS